MAYLDDLLAEIREPNLRRQIEDEIRKLKRGRPFGLVFEEHLPETAVLPRVAAQVGSTVLRRDDPGATIIFRVSALDAKGRATLVPVNADGEPSFAHVENLRVVKPFGEPIYPTLVSVDEARRADDQKPCHAVINGENFHALQLLVGLYERQVDCIYIDPPYNTGARDWKYNNDYVDDNDAWRHSKWLSFMEKRLLLARRLLKNDSVLIVTIDEHEVHHLRMLLEQIFPDAYIQMVTIVVNPKGVAQGRFARVEEYALYCFFGSAGVNATDDDFMSDSGTQRNTRSWKGLLRAGTNALPSDGLNMVYPIAVDPEKSRIVGLGRTLKERIDAGEVDRKKCNDWKPDPKETHRGYPVVWPVRRDGSLGVWQAKPETLLDLNSKGYLRTVRRDGEWAFSYVPSGVRKKIDSGEIVNRVSDGAEGPAVLERMGDKARAKTVWKRAEHDAGWHGSVLLRDLLGSRRFDFPKSVFAVRDALSTVIGDRPSALIVDFFAGSGTTLHATALLNREDGGSRRCVLVTNNEVSEQNAKTLRAAGHFPGDPEFERHGVFELVTLPRCKAVVTGKRADGTPIPGEHADGQAHADGFDENVEFFRLDYLDPDDVDLGYKFDEILPLLWLAAGGVGPRPVTAGTDSFLMPEGSTFAVIFRVSGFRRFREALERRPEVTHVWVVTDSEEACGEMRARLPPGVMLGMLYRDYLRNFRINARPNR